MTEDELRTLVREAVARHVDTIEGRDSWSREDARPQMHASHGLLPVARGSDGDGACLIEPAVRCNHCGYCLSYGH